ncbi:hypothetical protein VC83_02424 [Pseudogymnoascus destructans]|uniref:non-specific serine/threonine protein kinase n=1 Tax=Pseudogymnoascus destructans TaxID=655981 RepID=A0A177AG15_9PEZI|nr:uncharacterized protein VC83_02424 [Pseudogymnoascus destructans]OAF61017.2 hypothetical protein VC83_02424 [Pseudogymnoascus destructans]
MFSMQIICILHVFLYVARVEESLLPAAMIASTRDGALGDNIGSFQECLRGDVRVWMTQGGASIFVGTEEFSAGSHAITSRSQIVSFGNLTYCLEYVNADEVTYQSNLNAYFRWYLSRPAPPPDISATPSPWDFTLDDWVCKGTAGSGGFGTVSAAKHRVTGEPAAAKTIVRTSKTMRDIAGELSILDHLPSHPQLLVKRGVYYERGDTWFTSPENEDDERHGLPARPERVVFIIQPFARLTLTEMLLKLSPDLRIIAFYQLLQGVHALHNASPFPLLHRDLKLSNIGVVSYDERRIAVVILDYGQTVQIHSQRPISGKAALLDTKRRTCYIRSMV